MYVTIMGEAVIALHRSVEGALANILTSCEDLTEVTVMKCGGDFKIADRDDTYKIIHMEVWD